MNMVNYRVKPGETQIFAWWNKQIWNFSNSNTRLWDWWFGLENTTQINENVKGKKIKYINNSNNIKRYKTINKMTKNKSLNRKTWFLKTNAKANWERRRKTVQCCLSGYRKCSTTPSRSAHDFQNGPLLTFKIKSKDPLTSFATNVSDLWLQVCL